MLIEDRRYYTLRDEKNRIINTGNCICFGNILTNFKAYNDLEKNPTFYEHYFTSNLEYNTLIKVVKIYRELGLFRNVSYEYVPKAKVRAYMFKGRPSKTKQQAVGHPVFKMRADLRVCSPQEYQFVGFLLRMITNSSELLLSWLELIEKYPTRDKFILLIIAHTCDMNLEANRGSTYVYKPQVHYQFGHTLSIGSCFPQVKDVSIKKILAKIDTYAKPFAKSTTRDFQPSLTEQLTSYRKTLPAKFATLKYHPEKVDYYFDNVTT